MRSEVRTNGKLRLPRAPARRNVAVQSVDGVAGQSPDSTLAGLQVVLLPIDKIHRRPSNRGGVAVTPQEVTSLAASIEAFGQSTPIEVRSTSEEQTLPIGHWELVKGERRWTACRSLGQDRIAAIVRTYGAAEAAIQAGIDNAERADLDPIQRALAIQDAIGHGVPRDQAGLAHGIGSESGIDNALRLLELPDKLRQLVSAGELPVKMARYCVPFVRLPAVMAQVAKAVREGAWWLRNDAGDYRVKSAIQSMVHDLTRPVTAGQKRDYGWELGQSYPCLFKVTPELREQLDVVEIRLNNKPVEVARNVELYDTFQIPAIKARLAAAKRKAAERGGNGQVKSSAADQKIQQEQRARRLGELRAAWLHDWQRRLIAERLDAGNVPSVALQVFGTWLMFAELDRSSRDGEQASQAWFGNDAYLDATERWDVIRSLAAEDGRLYGSPQRSRALDDQLVIYVRGLMLRPDRKPEWPLIPHDVVTDWASDVGIDRASAWADLQREARATGGELRAAEVEAFWLIHRRDELAELAGELGVFVPASANRKGIVTLLGAATRTLALPGCLKG